MKLSRGYVFVFKHPPHTITAFQWNYFGRIGKSLLLDLVSPITLNNEPITLNNLAYYFK